MPLKNWVVLAENYPPMPLPERLDTKDQESAYQFVHPYKEESLGTQAGSQSEQGGGGRLNQTTRMSEREMRRDQRAADVNQQLTWSQFRGPGAN